MQALDQGQRCKDGDDTAFFSDGLKISELKHVVFFLRHVHIYYQRFLIKPCEREWARMIWRPDNLEVGERKDMVTEGAE